MYDENLAYDDGKIYRVVAIKNDVKIVIFIRSLVQLTNFLDLEVGSYDEVVVTECDEREDLIC